MRRLIPNVVLILAFTFAVVGTVRAIAGSALDPGTIPNVSVATGTLGVANGGTGASTLTANNVVLGNGTSAVQFVAPSTSGNVLTSNGTTWASATPTSSGGNGWPPAAPSSPSAYDDEFTASTLDAKWTVGGTATVGGIDPFDSSFNTANGWRYSLTQRPGWLVGQASSNNSFVRGLSQTALTLGTNWFMYIHIASLNRGTAGYANDDGEFSLGTYAGVGPAAGFVVTRDDNRLVVTKYENPTFTDIATPAITLPGGVEYIGISKAGTTLRAFYATANGTWVFIVAATMAGYVDPIDIELRWRNSSAYSTPGLLIYGIDFFRFQTGATPSW